MKQIIRIAFFSYLLWFSFVVFLNLKGDIAFGHGLGDLYYLIFLVSLTILSLIFYLRIIKGYLANKKMIYLFIVYLIVIVVSFSLKLTLFRGAEFPWDGNIFL